MSSLAAPVAVVLVAGVGERLRPITNDRPKALVEVGAETMLHRALRLLIEHGVEEIVLATGYCEDAVRQAVAGMKVPVTLCRNPLYDRTQNSVSLLLCEGAVAGRDFYKLDGDLLFRSEVLRRLDEAEGELAVAVDVRASLGAEEMKVQCAAGSKRIEMFGKGLDPSRSDGESIGIERVSAVAVSPLFHALRRAQEAGETQLYYEDVYSRLIAEGLRAEMVPVSDLAWAEVDTADDLAHARDLIARAKL